MKTIVYTTIFGESDSLKPAPQGVEAVCFVDDPSAYPDALGWDLRQAPARDPRREAWRLRCIPHLLFQAYERVIWIDASFTLTDVDRLLRDTGKAEIAALRHHRRSDCYAEGQEIAKVGQADARDVNRQLEAYNREHFRPSHLSISCVIVRSRSLAVQHFNETWNAEIQRHPGDNTQLSLDYAAWRHGLTIAPLTGSRHENPYATHDHSDHKKRRKPYARSGAAA